MASNVGITLMNTFCRPASKFFANYINYMDREEAVKKEHLPDFDLFAAENFGLFSGYMDYMGNPEKAHAQDKPEKISGLFTANRDNLSKEEIKSLKSAFRTAQAKGSLMWQTVLSFDNDWLKEMGIYKDTGLDEKRFQTCARAAIGKMLESENLKNAIWTAAVHYNTDNIHIHVGIVEPEPMRKKKKFKQWEIIQKDGKWQYKRQKNPATGKMEKVPVVDASGRQLESEEYIGKFKLQSLKNAKAEMMSFLQMDKASHSEINKVNQRIRENIVGSLKAYALYEDEDFRTLYEAIYEKLPSDKRTWKYGYQKMNPLRTEIDALSEAYIKKYCTDEFEMFSVNLRKKEEEYQKAYGGETNHYAEKQIKELYHRMGNAILFSMRMYDKKLQLETDGEYESYASAEMSAGQKRKEKTYSTKAKKITEPSYRAARRKRTGKDSIRSILAALKHSLENTAEKILNQQEYERLQREIGGGEIEYERMQGDWYHHLS